MQLKDSLIVNNSIVLNGKASNYQEAVKIGTDALVRAGVVEPRYFDAIINSIKTHGPYICIHDAFAMPHSRPEDGVLKTGFALTVLSHPVKFDGVDIPVDVLITLAGKDDNEHIEATMQIATLIEFDEDFSQLRACKTEFEVFDLIERALENIEVY